MNSTLSIRLENDVKQSFLTNTKAKGLEWSVLIRHFIKKFNEDPDRVKFDLDEQIFDDLFSDPRMKTKLEAVSDKLDKLWF